MSMASAVDDVGARLRPFDNRTDSRATPSSLMTGKSSPSTFPVGAVEAEVQQPLTTSTSSRDIRRMTLAGPAAPIRTLRRKRLERPRRGPVGSSHGDLGSCRKTVLRGGAGVLRFGCSEILRSTGLGRRSDGLDGDGVRGAAAAVGANQTWEKMDNKLGKDLGLMHLQCLF